MTHPRVIALAPTWNAASFIDKTLDSLAAQTYPNLSILVSDDCSTDGTAAICVARAQQDDRFKLVQQPRNLGWVGNANALLRMAEERADYLLFAWHDDLLAPSYVERLVARLEANRNAVIAFSDLSLTHLDGRQEIQIYDELTDQHSAFLRAKSLAWQIGKWWAPVRGVFRAEAARQIGGLKAHGGGEFCADWPWMLRMATLGEFERVPETLCFKFFKSASLSKKWQYNMKAYRSVTFSAAKEVRASNLSLKEKLWLHLSLARQQFKHERNARRA
jgi:glycosyltransferase involved in cell wall biosynthesis